jgi:MraZ protein
MFRGHSNHTLDDKGRIIIPSRFREILRTGGGDNIMLAMFDSSLYAYPFERWKEIETDIMEMPKKSATLRRFRRVFIGGAFECTCDKQGRILIPPTLRDYAGIKKELVLAGAIDHFEIWDRKRWAKQALQLEEEMEQEEARSEIDELGL